MDGNNSLSAGDILALTGDKGESGMNFWWVIVFLIVAGMFGGFNGFGGFGNNGNVANLGADEFLQHDLFNTNQNVSNSACQTQRDILENRYTNQLGMQNLQAQLQACCCDSQKEIIQSRYDSALANQNLQAQIAQNYSNLRAEGQANTQKILDKMCENEINQLRTDLQSAKLQLSQVYQTGELVNTLRPTPMPAYITCSPYQAGGCPYYGVSSVV